VLAAAEGSPLWLVVRDPHRYTWMDQAVDRLGAARPDAVVIDTGWPGWEPPRALAHVVTYGASWACGQAVVELLAAREGFTRRRLSAAERR
jgi:beta-N-acetylhexosaminidase